MRDLEVKAALAQFVTSSIGMVLSNIQIKCITHVGSPTFTLLGTNLK